MTVPVTTKHEKASQIPGSFPTSYGSFLGRPLHSQSQTRNAVPDYLCYGDFTTVIRSGPSSLVFELASALALH